MGRFFKIAVLLQVFVMSCVQVTPAWLPSNESLAVVSTQQIIEQKCAEYMKYSGCVGNRIIGGSPAKENQFPFMVVIALDGVSACGGTLISEKFVLTAANCIIFSDARPNLTAFMGVLKKSEIGRSQPYRVVRAIYPAEYVPLPVGSSEAENTDDPKNIALLELESPVPLNQTIYPACVFSGDSNQLRSAVVAGWGRTNRFGEDTWPDVLQWVELNIRPYCRQSGLLCAGFSLSRGICQGDAGAPVVTSQSCRPYLVGITARFMGLESCIGFSMFTDVSRYSRWISHYVWNSWVLPEIESKVHLYSF